MTLIPQLLSSAHSYISIVESKNTCLEVSDVNGGDIVIRVRSQHDAHPKSCLAKP